MALQITVAAGGSEIDAQIYDDVLVGDLMPNLTEQQQVDAVFQFIDARIEELVQDFVKVDKSAEVQAYLDQHISKQT